MLSKLYPENGVATHFFGFEITNLNQFFMIFVFLSGAAAIVLFLLSKKMLKMMHGLR
jgi:POT family proton-dependent oligopeptide transporter